MSTGKPKILCIVGTRPEAIKMAPVVLALKGDAGLDVALLLSGQHRHLAAQALEPFAIRGDMEIDAMQPDQTLAGLTGRLFLQLERVVVDQRPRMIVAQGDTTTVMVSALICFYAGIAFAHVEAGLRTGDLANPFPEEFNRIIAGRAARLNFAPTRGAKAALLAEGIDPRSITITGNTVIDALNFVRKRLPQDNKAVTDRRRILLTVHRRENFGAPIESICRGVLSIVERFEDVEFVFPVHPNPNVKRVVELRLGGHPRVLLSEPLGYVDLVAAMDRAHLVLTDSGGIQEEAPALGKPVLILRTKTERPEAVESGVARLVGTAEQDIFESVAELLDDPVAYRAMARGISPYGDGQASRRINQLIRAHVLGETAHVDEFCADRPGGTGLL